MLMRNPSRLCALLFLVTLWTPLKAQDDALGRNGWGGLLLDASTAEDAERLLGRPDGRKENVKLTVRRIDKWLAGKQKQKLFRVLTYKHLKGYKSAQLSFLEGRLVAIDLELPDPDRAEPGWIDPDELSGLFDTPFKPLSLTAKLPTLREVQTTAPTEFKKYDWYYQMVAISDKSIIYAHVDNDKSVGGRYGPFGPDPTAESREREKKRARKVIDAQGKYPGYVISLQLISRSLAAS